MKLHLTGNQTRDDENALVWLDYLRQEEVTRGVSSHHRKAAVEALQAEYGLEVTGEVNDETRKLMNRLLAERG